MKWLRNPFNELRAHSMLHREAIRAETQAREATDKEVLALKNRVSGLEDLVRAMIDGPAHKEGERHPVYDLMEGRED